MPHAFELPRMRRVVVPHMSAGDAVVHEFVSNRLPRLASVIRSLDQLPKPSAGLRSVQPVRIRWRSFHVIKLPAREVWPAYVPTLALAVRGQHKRALARAHQNSHTAHFYLRCETCRLIFA